MNRDRPHTSQLSGGDAQQKAPSPQLLIRTASILLVALTLGHMSAYPWSSARVAEQVRLSGTMRSVPFGFMGQTTTYWNLYFGWGMLVGILLLALAIVVWLLAELIPHAPRIVAKLCAVIAGTSLIGAYLSWRFFFLPPCLLFLAIAISLSIATLILTRRSSAEHFAEDG